MWLKPKTNKRTNRKWLRAPRQHFTNICKTLNILLILECPVYLLLPASLQQHTHTHTHDRGSWWWTAGELGSNSCVSVSHWKRPGANYRELLRFICLSISLVLIAKISSTRLIKLITKLTFELLMYKSHSNTHTMANANITSTIAMHYNNIMGLWLKLK